MSGGVQISRSPVNPATGGAEIFGTVSDRSGAVIPRATVTLINATGAKFAVSTNAYGKFSLDGLREGDYTIETSSMGFRKAVRRFALRENESAAIDVTLDVGATTETITVTAQARCCSGRSRRAYGGEQ